MSPKLILCGDMLIVVHPTICRKCKHNNASPEKLCDAGFDREKKLMANRTQCLLFEKKKSLKRKMNRE